MPIFEYTCDACGRRFSALVGVVANPKGPACPKCGGQALTRQVSRFARVRSEDDRMESLADESKYGDIENDPRAMRRFVKGEGHQQDQKDDEDLGEIDVRQGADSVLEERGFSKPPTLPAKAGNHWRNPAHDEGPVTRSRRSVLLTTTATTITKVPQAISGFCVLPDLPGCHVT